MVLRCTSKYTIDKHTHTQKRRKYAVLSRGGRRRSKTLVGEPSIPVGGHPEPFLWQRQPAAAGRYGFYNLQWIEVKSWTWAINVFSTPRGYQPPPSTNKLKTTCRFGANQWSFPLTVLCMTSVRYVRLEKRGIWTFHPRFLVHPPPPCLITFGLNT